MIFKKDWFTISKLIFHFLEYYKLNHGTTNVDRIKLNVRAMSSNTHNIDLTDIEITKNNITKALNILGIKRCRGIGALINNTYPIYFDHQKYLQNFRGIGNIRFAVMGGIENV